jgi:hypothetical protein
LGANETVLADFGKTGGAFGGGLSMTGAFGVCLISFFGTATVLAAGSDAGDIAGPAAAGRGPGKDTKLTLIDPCLNLGRGFDPGINTTDPKKIRWITSEIPK